MKKYHTRKDQLQVANLNPNKSFSSSKTPGFIWLHHQVLKDKIKEKLIIIPNIEEEGIFPNIFYEGSINLIHKPQEDENK